MTKINENDDQYNYKNSDIRQIYDYRLLNWILIQPSEEIADLSISFS